MTIDGMQPGHNPEKTALGGSVPAGPEALEVIHSISGEEIEKQLIELARIGGRPWDPTPEQPERYGTNRLALSARDRQAQQEFVIPRMLDAGAFVAEYPLGIVGTFIGKDPSLPPVSIMSHTDTVKDGDMYDGVTGVLSGIELMKAMNETGYQPGRNVSVISVTGEESAPFNIALFGSKAMFLGLNEHDLSMVNAEGRSIGDILGPHSDKVRFPLFGNSLPNPAAVIELHVEQSKHLEEKDAGGNFIHDIGVVEAIAAPERYSATVGDRPLPPDTQSYPHEKYFQLTVNGKAAHSGATPMKDRRADGLVETATYLTHAASEYGHSVLSIGDVDIEGGGMMNTIPGVTTSLIRLAGETEQEIREAEEYLFELTGQRNKLLTLSSNNFDDNPIDIAETSKPEEPIFFNSEEMLRRQLAAFGLVRSIHDAAMANEHKGVVGTVGVFDTTADGRINMKIDVRGIESTSRSDTLSTIHSNVGMLSAAAYIEMSEPLPGSGEPVQMDEELVEAAINAIGKFETGKARRMISAAGHDAQNAARAGIPTVMLFCRSRDGIAHNPNAYTSPADLEKGARSLAALALSLAA